MHPFISLLWCFSIGGLLSPTLAIANVSPRVETPLLAPPLSVRTPMTAFLKAKRYQGMAQSLEQQALQKIMPKTSSPRANVMILASLGMPKASLQALLQQANHYHVPIVLRGLYRNDFQQTIARVQALIAPNNNEKPLLGGVEINPQVFKTFRVSQVPAFIVVGDGKCDTKAPCPTEDFDVVYGNVSLPNALELLAQGHYKHLLRGMIP